MLVGESGCGKTTLLRQLSGNSGLQGKEKGTLSVLAKNAAYVWQNPERQIVTNCAEHELVFALENEGRTPCVMRRKLAEIVAVFGLEDILEKDTMSLSGGEKQILNVAASLITSPEILLLDEPSAQLDPVSATRLYDMLRHINEDYGITIIIAEQRLEEAITYADTMLLLEKGTVIAQGGLREVYRKVQGTGKTCFFPNYVNMFMEEIPLTKKEARLLFNTYYREKNVEKEMKTCLQESGKKKGISCKNLRFRYEKKGRDVLRDCTCHIMSGKITCFVGANGSGKTTLLRILGRQFIPYSGKVKGMPEKISFLSQNPDYMFCFETVEKELFQAGEMAEKLWRYFGMKGYEKRHPYDLSGGEKQRLALCLALGKEADCYLLDEPTKGMDNGAKYILLNIIKEIKKQGKTVLFVSHDMEFIARAADEIALMFQGKTETKQSVYEFFQGNAFYTTSLHQITKEVSSRIVVEEDVLTYVEKK